MYFVCGKTSGNSVSEECVLAMTTSATVAAEMCRANGPKAYYCKWEDLTESQKGAARWMLKDAEVLVRKVRKEQKKKGK